MIGTVILFKEMVEIENFLFTLNLSHPSTYVGGEFEFDYRDTKKGSRIETVKHVKDKGSCIVFPSYMWHRKVTKGTRYSLVVWLQKEIHLSNGS